MRRRLVLLVAVALLAGCSTKPRTTVTAEAASKQPVPVTFDAPSGFAGTTDYRLLVPLHALRETQWVVPAGERGYDVIAVVSYVLDTDATGATDDQLAARVDGYAEKVAAISTTPPVRTTVADYPAMRQTIKQPNGSVPLTYDATFVFAGPFMAEVICQYDKQPDVVHAACASVLDTLRIVTV